MENTLLARQSIYDEQLDVVAYELLFRGHGDNEADVVDGDAATSNVIVNTFANVGMDQVVGRCPAFINFTRNLLLNSSAFPLPKEQVVIEVLEDVLVDQDLLESIKTLAAQGYRIALDDFIYKKELEPLIKLAHIIKIDVLDLNEKQIAEQLKTLQDFKGTLLAEKVETHEQFECCKSLGFERFQGFFLSKPNLVKGKKISANRTAVMNLLIKLEDPETEVSEVVETISHDPTLCYKLLRIVNSAIYGSVRKVDSLEEAMVRLGFETIRNWAVLITFSAMDNKPCEVIERTLIRAKMCESIAIKLGIKETSTFFTVGLLSNLDALLDEELPILLEKMPLADEVKDALLLKAGKLGAAYRRVISYERGDWDSLSFKKITADDYSDIYLESIDWAKKIVKLLS